jgi:putative membrane protein
MTFQYFAQWMSFVCFFVAALLHFGFFIVQSFLYQRPHGYKLFKTSPEHHAATKIWAFNQGFYNLFLSIGTFWGLFYVLRKEVMLAGVLTSFCGFFMIGAGLVLWFSQPRLRRGALLQMVPPALGFLFLAVHILHFIKPQ